MEKKHKSKSRESRKEYMKKSFQRINIPKLPVLTTEQAMKNIKDNLLDVLNKS